jgi:Restriction endonuclease
MIAVAENIAKIQAFESHDALLGLWNQILERATPDWAPGVAFEFLILRAFELEGAAVEYPFSVELFGEAAAEQIDGMVQMKGEGLVFLAESKDWKDPIAVAPIAKLRNQLARRPAQLIGCLFSTSGFTEPAKLMGHFLAPQTILLWDGDDIDFCLRNRYFSQGVFEKHTYAMKEGKPYLNLMR